MSRMTRHHIAHILPSPSWTGAEAAALRITQGLGGGPFRHTIFCPNEAVELRNWFAAAGVETAGYSLAEADHRRPDLFLRDSSLLADEFRRRGVGLVHCAEVPAGQAAALAAVLAGAQVVCHVRYRHEQILGAERGALRAVDHFVFASHDTRAHFGYEVDPGRASVIYDGVDISDGVGLIGGDGPASGEGVRGEFGLPRRSKIVGILGPVEPEKDFATLIKAAAQVLEIDAGVRFLIVGGEAERGGHREYFREVQERLAHRYLAPHFIFTGDRSDLPRLLTAMDVLVHCAHTGAWPAAIIEAMAQGRPVIATAVGQIPEIVRDGETGWLHRPGDEIQLAAQILSMIHNPARAAAFGGAGRQFVGAYFNRGQFAGKIASLYRGLLEEKSPAAFPRQTDPPGSWMSRN